MKITNAFHVWVLGKIRSAFFCAWEQQYGIWQDGMEYPKKIETDHIRFGKPPRWACPACDRDKL